jgi:hypothetical protein
MLFTEETIDDMMTSDNDPDKVPMYQNINAVSPPPLYQSVRSFCPNCPESRPRLGSSSPQGSYDLP